MSFVSLPTWAQMDLHGHFDIKPGIGPLIQGDFHHPPLSTEWSSKLKTKASGESLLALKHPTILMASLYSHPVLSISETPLRGNSLRDALEIEYQNLRQFVFQNASRFGFARNSDETRKLLAQNKSAIVLAIEGASGILETEEDFKLWVDERGVASVTPFHLMEDHFGGVALMPGLKALNSPFEFLKSIFSNNGKCLQSFCQSTVGLKPDGRALIERLLARQVWIDLAHANELEIRDLLPLFKKSALPLLVSHTQLREFFPGERGIGQLEIDYIREHDGIIGLIPTESMMTEAPIDLSAKKCSSGLEKFKLALARAREILGIEKVALASDVNAPMSGVSGSSFCTGNENAGSELEARGYYTYSQWDDLLDFSAPSNESENQWQKKTREHFLRVWKKVRW